MLTLLRRAEIFTPDPAGRQDVLLAGGKILRLAAGIEPRDVEKLDPDAEIVDASGCLIAPGLIDPHEHLTGGSGEEGYASRSPEIQLTELTTAGITTVVGCLGTDAVTRSLEGLLAKVKGFAEEGLTACMYTGSYDLPLATLTGSPRRDLLLIAEVIGVGEIAVSDERAAQPDPIALERLVIDARTAGKLSSKAGVTHFHVGEEKERLAPLRALLDTGRVDPAAVYPTHVQRTPELLAEAAELSRRGCCVDMDTTEEELGPAVAGFREAGGDLEKLTVSSDADSGSPSRIWSQLRAAVQNGHLPLDQALRLATRTTARVLHLKNKGVLEPGRDADLLVLDAGSLEIRDVIAGGRFLPESRRHFEIHGGKSG
jgi:beta-aspartyl-dipeptidase (metallo-type)